MTKPDARSCVVNVRMNCDELALLRAAAAQARTQIRDFVRRATIEAAEMDVLNRSKVAIPAERWEAFEAWAARPAETVPGLEQLLRRKPTWER